MTIILDTCVYVCVLVHPFLTKSNQIPCTYVFDVTLPMCLLFYNYIWQSCSEVVVTLVIHVINQTMNSWRLTKSLLYFIQYVTLKYNYIEYQSFKYWCIFFYLTVICIPIKSHQSNQIYSTTLQSFIGCEYSSYFTFCILWLTIHVYA